MMVTGLLENQRDKRGKPGFPHWLLPSELLRLRVSSSLPGAQLLRRFSGYNSLCHTTALIATSPVVKMRGVVSAKLPTKTSWFWASFPGHLSYPVFRLSYTCHGAVLVLLSKAGCLDGAELPSSTLCLASLPREMPGSRIWVQTDVYPMWLGLRGWSRTVWVHQVTQDTER